MRWIPLLLLACAMARGDTVTGPDGVPRTGAVTEVRFTPADGPEQRLTRAQLFAVHLATDRELTDLRWLVRMQSFALRRPARDSRVGVYIGAGAFPPSALALVRRLDPALLFARDFNAKRLARLDTIVFPGGWAPSMLAALGERGQRALHAFVTGGGRYLGICAGGYLPCANVVWDGATFPYPVALVQGTAAGPVPGLVPYSERQSVKLSTGPAIYAGGSAFDVKGARVLVRYPNGSAAAVVVKRGKGRLVLSGAHVEFTDKEDADLLREFAVGHKAGDGKTFQMLWRELRR